MMDSYDPRDFMIGHQDVKSGWIVAVLINIAVLVLSI